VLGHPLAKVVSEIDLSPSVTAFRGTMLKLANLSPQPAFIGGIVNDQPYTLSRRNIALPG
jgi:hypothetical protein